jgi:hypothetical protein
MKMLHNQKILLGEAAEHLVLARLLRRGIVASQAPRTWKDDDILGVKGLRAQVKATVKGAKQGWMVGDVKLAPNRFYAFVEFSDEANPSIYVAPCDAVRAAAEEANRQLLIAFPNAHDVGMRKIQDPFPPQVTGYKEGWLTEPDHDPWDQLNRFSSFTEEPSITPTIVGS